MQYLDINLLALNPYEFYIAITTLANQININAPNILNNLYAPDLPAITTKKTNSNQQPNKTFLGRKKKQLGCFIKKIKY